MYCSKCGSKIDEGSAFCSSCGQPSTGTALPGTQEQTSIRPPKRLSKKFIAIFSGVVVVIAVICAVAFVHHAQGNQIVGYWKSNQGGGINTSFAILNQSEFFSDGYKGKYTISGNKITLNISNKPLTFDYTIKNNILTFGQNGQDLTYVKMTSEQIASYKKRFKLQ